MDLEEWEILPKNSYESINLDLDLARDEDHEATKMMRNTGKSFDMDYYICPIQDSVGKTEFLHQRSNVVPTHLLQIPITWEPVSTLDDTDHNKYPVPDFSEPDPELLTESLPSPRITFKKLKETEFADMKIDSPARLTSPLPQNDEKHSDSEGGLGGEYYDEIMVSEVEEGCDLRSKKEVEWDEDESIGGDKMNLWKKGLNGIGAICSFGVAAAAATICVFFLGHNNNIQGSRNKNQILRFQIYSDDNKRMNEVVKHATKLNEAISIMKCLPVTRAQISFGGYYDGI